MPDDRLTPEHVTEKVLAAFRAIRLAADAVDAYEASLRPQPVECLMIRMDGDWWLQTHPDFKPAPDDDVWRVTITPIERVR